MAADDLYFTGARAAFIVNVPGQPARAIADATDVSGGEAIERVPVNVLNNIRTKAFPAVGYTATLRASRVYVHAEELKAIGLFPKSDVNVEQHLRNVLSLPEMTVEIRDTYSTDLFWQATGVQITSHGFSFGARDIVLEDVEFVVKMVQCVADSGSATA